ncbi:DNA binding domain-containing protein, excisionase family [Saccharopolyspora shandongensis]|uniref:DNA binding domain-containing protein, excisionase family n=1 Tax=Saccharopolyspora shandongensis TaxID=418495 RepID=A0A1H3H4G2_9PSEU|nr:helix-turn-helix domain-containing protein [Saccharopolyspora shandongensis]SDY10473.1 DNA binding domain-containing protein, excisionase family [Saccharopolyspora shandongensis]
MQFERNAFYRVKAVAEMFDVSVNTIYRAIESGELDALKLGTGKGTLRVPGRALDVYVEKCSQAAYEAFVTGNELAAEAADDTQVGEVA